MIRYLNLLSIDWDKELANSYNNYMKSFYISFDLLTINNWDLLNIWYSSNKKWFVKIAGITLIDSGNY